jgi:hypothetical protein
MPVNNARSLISDKWKTGRRPGAQVLVNGVTAELVLSRGNLPFAIQETREHILAMLALSKATIRSRK